MKARSFLWMALAVAPAMALTSDKTATIFAAGDVQSELSKLVAKAEATGSSGSTLATTGNLALKTSVRTTSGGAEIHAHFDDLMIVEQGSATIVTGGTIANAKTDAEGETKGAHIEGGVSREVKPGDIIIVPAGVPHQLIIPKGVTYTSLVAKIKEP